MNILVVGSGKVIYTIIRKTLCSFPVKVDFASDPRSAVQYSMEHHPSLILLERTLQDTEGLSVYKKLKNNSRTKDIPVVLVASSISDEEMQEMIGLGIYSVLKKPFTQEGLLAQVNQFLPLAWEKEARESKKEEPKVSVLVVDDDPVTRKIVAKEFPEEAYSLSFASNGKEALEKVNAGAFHYVITDLEMPEMDGYELCSEIKTNLRTASVPVIILTGTTIQDARTRGFAAGAAEFIKKPFQAGALREYVEGLAKKLRSKLDRTILIAAKKVTTLQMISLMVKKKGMKTVLCADSKSVLEACKEKEIDLIILEEELQDAEGLQLVNILRGEYRDIFLPILFLSKEKENRIALAYKHKINALISEPFEEEELLGLINANIGARRIFNELQSRNKILHDLSITDGLTKLYNKSFTEQFCEKSFLESQENNEPLSCFFIDADHFKSVNDTHGHDFGDLVLKDLSRKIQKHTPKGALAGRFGGEEFVMVLPGKNIDESCEIAEAVREDVETHTFTDGKTELKATVSIGVCSFPGVYLERFTELLKYADNALYHAKKSGRNRVWRYSPMDEDENLTDTLRIYQAMFENSLDGIVSVDVEGKIKHYNKSSERIFQYSAPEILNQRIERLLPERYRVGHVKSINQYIREGTPKLDKPRVLPALRKDGVEIKVEVMVSVLGQGEKGEFLAIIREHGQDN